MRLVLGCVVGVVAASGCFLIPPGGGGGTGGGTALPFSSGYVTVRRDDRALVLTDERDVNSPQVLVASGGAMPSFSRDGRQIVFTRRTEQGTELALVPVTGGTPSTVLRSSATVQNLRTPAFSPDGTTIAFAYDDNPPSSSVGLVNVDGSNFRKLIGGSALAYSSPTWFPDGRAILAAAANAGLPPSQVERVDVMTGMPTSITNTLGGEAMGIASRLQLSPDGRLAVFDGRVASGVTRIFVIDLATRVTTRQRNAMGAVNDSAPSWVAPNVFVFSSDEGGGDQAYRQTVGMDNATLAVPLAIEPAYGALRVTSADGGVDGGVDGGP